MRVDKFASTRAQASKAGMTIFRKRNVIPQLFTNATEEGSSLVDDDKYIKTLLTEYKPYLIAILFIFIIYSHRAPITMKYTSLTLFLTLLNVKK